MQYFPDKPRNIWISRICQALAHARTAPLAVGLAGVTQLMDDGFSFSVCVSYWANMGKPSFGIKLICDSLR